MMGLPTIAWSTQERQFRVSCNAAEENRLRFGVESAFVTVGQLIQRHGRIEMWDSVGVHAQEDRDGALVIRVMVFNPDWDEPLQIACIRSRPRGGSVNMTALGCNLDHISL
jgi:hypothetical protein